MIEHTQSADYERGRIDALLEEHTSRLNKINGSIERHAKSNEDLTKAISIGLEKVGNEMRKMQEEARARDLVAEVAKNTLAREVDRRSKELSALADLKSRRWSLRDNKANVLVAVFAFGALVVAAFNAMHTIFG